MKQRCDDFCEELPWYPLISEERCKGCRTCFKFCRSGALVFNRARRLPRLKYPHRCRVTCRICESFCPVRAISFPDQSLFVEAYLVTRNAGAIPAIAEPPHDIPPALRRRDRFVFRTNRAALI